MKTLFITILIFHSYFAVAFTNVCKSDYVLTENTDTTCNFEKEQSIIIKPFSNNKVVIYETDISKLTELESRKIVDLLGGIGDFFIAIGQFYTFRSTFGYYKEKGQNGHGPYTLFDRSSTKSINQQLQDVRDWCYLESFFLNYKINS